MNTENILRMAREAGMSVKPGRDGPWESYGTDHSVERFFKLAYEAGAAAERNRMISEGWRQCAQGQRTTQFCAVAEQARAEERARACQIVTGLCISDNNAREICEAIRGKE